MYGRAGLDRFKKAESLEPFSVSSNNEPEKTAAAAAAAAVCEQQKAKVVGQGLSNWHPPDWAIEPRPGVYYLDVMKDGQVVDQIQLHKRKHIFGRQITTCDFVLDHQSVSRQHAAVVPHKNGSVYVIDLGSVHGTFVANERLSKETPVELEVGQSLRFAASTRSYILRKHNAPLFPPPPPPLPDLPPPPDPSNQDSVLAYNTTLNRYGISKPDIPSPSLERPTKRLKKLRRVSFKDQCGGELVQVVGISDGADVSTDPGPLGVKEGSLVGKYGSLVQTTIIPKGKQASSVLSSKGVTHKLQQVFDKVKAAPKTTVIYDDLYGEPFSTNLGSSWAHASHTQLGSIKDTTEKPPIVSTGTSDASLGYDNDDLFGDSLD